MILYLITRNECAEDCDHIEAWFSKEKAEVSMREMDEEVMSESMYYQLRGFGPHHISEVEVKDALHS